MAREPTRRPNATSDALSSWTRIRRAAGVARQRVRQSGPVRRSRRGPPARGGADGLRPGHARRTGGRPLRPRRARREPPWRTGRRVRLGASRAVSRELLHAGSRGIAHQPPSRGPRVTVTNSRRGRARRERAGRLLVSGPPRRAVSPGGRVRQATRGRPPRTDSHYPRASASAFFYRGGPRARRASGRAAEVDGVVARSEQALGNSNSTGSLFLQAAGELAAHGHADAARAMAGRAVEYFERRLKTRQADAGAPRFLRRRAASRGDCQQALPIRRDLRGVKPDDRAYLSRQGDYAVALAACGPSTRSGPPRATPRGGGSRDEARRSPTLSRRSIGRSCAARISTSAPGFSPRSATARERSASCRPPSRKGTPGTAARCTSTPAGTRSALTRRSSSG